MNPGYDHSKNGISSDPAFDIRDYELIRSKRKTMAIEVDRSGAVRVRAPYNVSNLKIREFVEDKREWIEKAIRKITERRQYGENSVPAGPRDGMRDNPSGDDMISTDEQVPLSEADLMALANEARAVIPGKVAFYASRIGVTYGHITIRHQKTRWGSCSSKGNLNFNCLLMQAPEEVLDYVIIHELCHRKHMNHSREFWEEVSGVCPGYKARRRWLRDHGDSLFYIV